MTDDCLLSQTRRYSGPVNRVPPRGEIVRPAILVLQVVGVFPHIHTEDDLLPFHDRLILVCRALDAELSAVINEPCPAAAEARHAGFVHLFLQRIETAEG